MIVRSCGDSVRGAGWQTLLAVTRFEVPRPFVLERVRFFPAFLLRLFLSQLRPSEHGETSKMEMAHPLIALQMVSHLRKTPHPLLKRRVQSRDILYKTSRDILYTFASSVPSGIHRPTIVDCRIPGSTSRIKVAQ